MATATADLLKLTQCKDIISDSKLLTVMDIKARKLGIVNHIIFN